LSVLSAWRRCHQNGGGFNPTKIAGTFPPGTGRLLTLVVSIPAVPNAAVSSPSGPSAICIPYGGGDITPIPVSCTWMPALLIVAPIAFPKSCASLSPRTATKTTGRRPLMDARASDSLDRCSVVSRRLASPASIFIRPNRSDSARSFASAARALASATPASSPAINSREWRRSESQWASLTPPIQTISIVATTPITRLNTKAMLATSETREAVSNDGHIRISSWFLLTAIAVVVVVGSACLIGLC
jgi:hypothetical protein